MKAVIDDKIPYIRGQIELLVESVVYMPGRDITADVVRDADILIVRTRTRCDRRLLEGSSVRLIVTATIGYDHIDTAYCQSAGISWTNCPGCNAASVCRYVMNALTVTHRLQPGLTVGIVGVGHVGTLVAQAALDHGMHVLLCDPPRRDRGEAEQLNAKLRPGRHHHVSHTAHRAASISHTPSCRLGILPLLTAQATHHQRIARCCG